MTGEELVALFDACAAAQRGALAGLDPEARRGRTGTVGQYSLDLVADAVVLPLLHEAGIRVLSEESGWTGQQDAEITVVLDPVDGSTNCARGIPYWAISLCALDADGALCALVTNGATGQRNAAIRGLGAWCDDLTMKSASTQRIEDSVVAIAGLPDARMAWKQFRALGSTALSLCDVAAGRIDAMLDFVDHQSPWDYLGGLLIAREAGAAVTDVAGRELVVADPTTTRQLVAAATPALLDDLLAAVA